MTTRRQLLRLTVSVAALGTVGALKAALAQVPAYRLYLPMVAAPSAAMPEPTVEPSPTPEPWPTPEPAIWPNPAGAILSPPSGSREQAISWLAARSNQYTRYDIEQIVGAYARIGTTVGLDWFLALAQCGHETGSLTSWWCARPRRNPAGIGVTGATLPGQPDAPPGVHWVWDGSRWCEGISFAAWDPDAISAHLGRLLAYTLPIGAGTALQQALIDYALGLRPLSAANRGSAATYPDLNGRWAVPGSDYGQRILSLAERMRTG